MPQYSWLKDPRFKVEPDGTTVDLLAADKKFEELVAARNLRVGTGDVNLSQYCVAMNQYSAEACTGNATCEGLEILENIATGNATVLSRLFTYAMARTIEGTLAMDAGSHVRTCFETLSLMGVCEETLWPYVLSEVCVSPSIQAQQQAVGHKVSGYYRISSSGAQRLTDIQTALYNHLPVVIGTEVGEDFENVTATTGPLGPPAASIGGHAIVIVGFVGGNYIVKNSWGTAWGNNGFCTFSPDYVTWDETDDLWVPTIQPPIFTS